MKERQWSLWPNITSCYHCNHDYESFRSLHGALFTMGMRGVLLGTDVAELAYDGRTVRVLWHRNFEAQLRKFVSQVAADALQAVRQFHPLPEGMEHAVRDLLWQGSHGEKIKSSLSGIAMMARVIPNPLTKSVVYSYDGTVDERRTTYRWLALRQATAAAASLTSNLATAYVEAYEAMTLARATMREDCDLKFTQLGTTCEHNAQLEELATAETGSPITRPPADQPVSSHHW